DDALLVPLVPGEQVVQPCADDAGYDYRDGDFGYHSRAVTGSAPANVGDLGRGEHPDREHQAVGVELDGPDVQDPVLRARDERQHGRASTGGTTFKVRREAGRCKRMAARRNLLVVALAAALVA